ncbi:hypothetical protein Pint_11244 [Pistacia integerrima]|uniref:Uncharacterized protein n=1 Tax=Pistacia integerrima TaxID=434235 RepID=A0ACC0XI13_9ROSI|nr:hypothetical protein Pint_11244 [Pistacia integerrima]
MSGFEEENQTQRAFGWAASDSSGILHPVNFTRRHEIVGEVIQVGAKVQKIKVGDKAVVGCFIGACGSCDGCQNGLESYCPKSITTYTIFDNGGAKNYGGYSDILVVDQHFAVHIPENLALEGVAPLLCAGITVFSPMKFFGLDMAGMHVGVVGLGGLGHLAVKFGKAFGMKVSVISTSPNKKIEAIEQKAVKGGTSKLDGIIATISPTRSQLPLLNLLKLNEKLILLTPPDLHKPFEIPVMPLFSGRRTISASMAAGMKETQEMIDFAAKHKSTANVEVISMDYVNKPMDRLAIGDVLYCGICHSDLHLIKNDFGNSSYPIVPGHEIVGVVTQVGSKVQKFKVGDKAGVGEGAAPLLGAGITVFSPMKFYALDKSGMHAAMGTMDGIFDTVSPQHPLTPLLNLLKFNGKLIMLSGPGLEKQIELSIAPLIFAKQYVKADVEVISMDRVNKAMDRLAKGDVHYRFVIDIANTIRPQNSVS